MHEDLHVRLGVSFVPQTHQFALAWSGPMAGVFTARQLRKTVSRCIRFVALMSVNADPPHCRC